MKPQFNGNRSRFNNLRQRLSEQAKREIMALSVPRPWRGLGLYLVVYLGIASAMLFESWAKNFVVTILLIFFIAGRQHSLYVLNHDASHYGLHTSRLANKILATWLSNLVMFHHSEAWSFIQWRRVHMLHHGHLFTKNDPNHVGRRLQGDTLQPLSASGLLLRCLKAGLLSPVQFFRARQDYVGPKMTEAEKCRFNHFMTLFQHYPGDPEMNRERWLKLFFFILTLSLIAHFDLWRPFLLLWILPMYTIYPMILTYYDLSEHRWTVDSTILNENTRSVRFGLFGRILFGFLPRGLHLEHHIFPRVIAFDLPELSRILEREGVIDTPASFTDFLGDLNEVKSAHELQS
ncbi:fatty acid desaturase family protein [Pseudomonas protegens]|uniref:fatty acid desaturase family protein n=1 Tax=Pseudomonas protegens TaxID=380021 RepID=UPI002745B48A|nr:fatty acid desaturase [Pseudomonas protegens]MDP9530560.1 fatty acid desaturase [Pseudomonas protegens]